MNSSNEVILESLYCDSCGEKIGTVKEGWVEWLYPLNNEDGSRNFKANGKQRFRIVHHPIQRGCMYMSGSGLRGPAGFAVNDMHLDYFWGDEGIERFILVARDGVADGTHNQVLQRIVHEWILWSKKIPAPSEDKNEKPDDLESRRLDNIIVEVKADLVKQADLINRLYEKLGLNPFPEPKGEGELMTEGNG